MPLENFIVKDNQKVVQEAIDNLKADKYHWTYPDNVRNFTTNRPLVTYTTNDTLPCSSYSAAALGIK